MNLKDIEVICLNSKNLFSSMPEKRDSIAYYLNSFIVNKKHIQNLIIISVSFIIIFV